LKKITQNPTTKHRLKNSYSPTAQSASCFYSIKRSEKKVFFARFSPKYLAILTPDFDQISFPFYPNQKTP